MVCEDSIVTFLFDKKSRKKTTDLVFENWMICASAAVSEREQALKDKKILIACLMDSMQRKEVICLLAKRMEVSITP